ncbi:MAG: ammonium transporter, partial [Pirellulales bacterium]
MGILTLSVVSFATAEEPTIAAAIEGAGSESAASEPAAPRTVEDMAYTIDNLFLMLCAVLVIFMQAGFAMVESGFNESKNTVNILFKNLMDFSVGALLFYLVGYGLMYPGADYAGKYFGFAGTGVSLEGAAPSGDGSLQLTPQVDFLFQVAFAATAATIVSGAVAERIKFGSVLLFSFL